MRVLLVEDTAGLGEAVRDQIADDGHAVDWVQTLGFAEASVQTTAYDLILLDLMLPDGHGLGFLRKLRTTRKTTPVIILTARDQVSDRIEGLNAGADDYLVKPFDLSELSARVAAVARRYRGDPSPVIQVGKLKVDLRDHHIHRNGLPVELTAREWALFEGFIQRPGMLLSRSQLEDRLYAFGAEIESNTIEVYVSRLRKKLGRDAIVTVRGMGYRLDTHGH
ncbi:response regulator transcription factor [Marinospirillum sp.]|uniref:response regulator transcription factor n=1 Tax=Marinospirillum sp. TaxID=2183934 RepID=UPI002870660B|nr:response regulator transcription factor [Marinospirillum sp.]MDR9467998.1 response regulator transcription factor [Marinospirillum sp.]